MITCSYSNCHSVHYGKGFCHTHYMRLRRHGKVDLTPREIKFCSVENCFDKSLAKNLCSKHYTRKIRHADVSDPREVSKRFWSKVEKTEKCWIWIRGRDKDGYGHFSIGNRENNRPVPAHRVAWQLTNGEIPKGLFVLHKCDNPPCVRPDHLFLGDVKDNAIDMVLKGRQATGLKNGKYTMPHRTPRGDIHGMRIKAKRKELECLTKSQ